MWPSTPHLTKRRKVEEIITHPLRYYVGDRNHPRNSIDSGSKLSPCLRAPPLDLNPSMHKRLLILIHSLNEKPSHGLASMMHMCPATPV